MKQTAVDWLEEELAKNLKHIVLHHDHEMMESLFKKAKEMEKQQIIDTFLDGLVPSNENIKEADQHYNQTFKS